MKVKVKKKTVIQSHNIVLTKREQDRLLEIVNLGEESSKPFEVIDAMWFRVRRHGDQNGTTTASFNVVVKPKDGKIER